jgi:NADH:ubiquinone oxidoreductase subunit 3 (subunit A)
MGLLMDWLLAPPLAFLAYLILAALLAGLGSRLAGQPSAPRSPLQHSWYASGEAPASRRARPGYQPFYLVAVFFAVVHLAVLVLATSGMAPLAGVYLLGVLLILVALILG